MTSVLLVTVDCLRADHVGCYGYDRPTTPNLDEFAEAATVFEHAYANGPSTRWALQTLHMGVCSHAVDGIGIPPTDGVPLAERLRSLGLTTGGFGNNGFVSRDYGYHRGFDTYHDVADFAADTHPIRRFGKWLHDVIDSSLVRAKLFTPLLNTFRTVERASSDGPYRPPVTDAEVCDVAVDWIRRQRADERPFFAWIHLMDAHAPYGRWNDQLEAIRGDTDVDHVIRPHDMVEPGTLAPEPVLDAYDAGIRSADEQVGRLLDAVGDDAVVAVTGDHGENLGRYDEFHAASLYGSMTQVPIVVRAPGLPDGRVDDYPVQHLDLPPTLVRAAGGEPPEDWQGDPLQDVDRSEDFPVFFCVDGEDVPTREGVRRDNWKYFTRRSGDEELYDVPHGTLEGEPVEDRADCRDELVGLLRDHRTTVDERMEGAGSADVRVGGEELSDAVQENLEDLGYVD